ncbi:hypothetical protein [Natrinema salaciae]|uniref:SWIM-type domain-containing protein n=1 Tax=Natrinema salaciae TaxID=1186196 RepID=A0A1H9P3G5_9EURY|nr:hypothetical protein [Natrinema salaciae]SER42740.1 hypothetical protein SAMN04489841_3849 [Natrinema salaciae]
MSTDQPIDREQHYEQHDYSDTSDREQRYSGDTARLNRHELIAIDEWLPGTEPTPYDIDLTNCYEYRTRYWRCRNCGQERNRRDEFRDQCETPAPPTPLEAGGYSIDNARTRRALSEQMDVCFTTAGSIYEVDSESGNTYEIDIEAETCSCTDFERRQPKSGCKHLRRVDLEIRTGLVLGPDGTFVR